MVARKAVSNIFFLPFFIVSSILCVVHNTFTQPQEMSVFYRLEFRYRFSLSLIAFCRFPGLLIRFVLAYGQSLSSLLTGML